MLRKIGQTLVIRNEIRNFCTAVETNRDEQKYMYSKNLNKKIENESKPMNWDNASPYSAIPGT